MERRWPPSKEELYELYVVRGLSIYKIADLYGVGHSTIMYYLKKYGIPTRKIMKGFKPRLDPSPELAYIIGVLLGDGTVSKCRTVNRRRNAVSYHYVIRLAVTDEAFAREFYEALTKIGLRPKIYFYPRKPNEKMLSDPSRCRARWIVYAENKEFYTFFKNLKIEDIEKIISGYEPHFIRGFYESEGCVDISPKEYRVRMVNTKKEIINLVNRVLIKLGFSTSLYAQKYEWKGETRYMYVVQIYGNDQVRRFFEIVKPVIRNPFV